MANQPDKRKDSDSEELAAGLMLLGMLLFLGLLCWLLISGAQRPSIKEPPKSVRPPTCEELNTCVTPAPVPDGSSAIETPPLPPEPEDAGSSPPSPPPEPKPKRTSKPKPTPNRDRPPREPPQVPDGGAAETKPPPGKRCYRFSGVRDGKSRWTAECEKTPATLQRCLAECLNGSDGKPRCRATYGIEFIPCQQSDAAYGVDGAKSAAGAHP